MSFPLFVIFKPTVYTLIARNKATCPLDFQSLSHVMYYPLTILSLIGDRAANIRCRLHMTSDGVIEKKLNLFTELFLCFIPFLSCTYTNNMGLSIFHNKSAHNRIYGCSLMNKSLSEMQYVFLCY